jgi:parvulin-like peptidyl-prolyl isomerase
MTFRAKPVAKRSQRPSWESRDRRSFYMNLGFGLVVVVAVVILVVAAALTWYNDHLAPVGSVDGQSITKDEFIDRYAIEGWRIREAQSRVRTQTLAGRLTEAQAEAQLGIIDQQQQQLAGIALERIIDTKLQAKLAAQEGVTATDADVDARLVTEATMPESRHAWVIEVEPEVDQGAAEPTEAQKTAAKAKAEQALTDLQGGKAWDEVARTVSTDSATAPQAGDLGWIQKEDSQTDEAFLTALFAAESGKTTVVVEGEDGIFRIGRVTEIAPETVDGAYTTKLENGKIDLAKYRLVVAGDVIHQKLDDKIVADAVKPSPQRQVSEIYIAEAQNEPPMDAVKSRHILYGPKDDPAAASAGEIPADDPSWAAAEAEARAAYARIKADPSIFDSVARAESDEDSARGVTGSGGKLPYFDASQTTVDKDYLAAITKPGLQPGDLLEPVRSAFGWHVIQVMYRPTDDAWIRGLKTKADAGADFAVLARDNSDSSSSGKGGDIGWVAKGQLEESLTTAIFATPVGKTSEVVTVESDGLYLFKVFAEEVRTPEGRQLEDIKASAFSNWYSAKKAATTIERDPTFAGLAG